MVLQGVAFHAGFGKLLGGPRSRSKALDVISFAFGGIANGSQGRSFARSGDTFQGHDLIAAAEYFFDSPALGVAQMGILLLDGAAGLKAYQSLVLILSRLHEADVFVLQPDHLLRSKLAADSGFVLLPLEEFALFDLLLEFLLKLA